MRLMFRAGFVHLGLASPVFGERLRHVVAAGCRFALRRCDGQWVELGAAEWQQRCSLSHIQARWIIPAAHNRHGTMRMHRNSTLHAMQCLMGTHALPFKIGHDID